MFTPMMAIRVQIYEDNNGLREMLSILVKNSPGFEFAGAFFNCTDVIKNIRSFSPDVVIMDVDMPEVNGKEGVKMIRKTDKKLPVLILTIFDDDYTLFELLSLGAFGYLLKGSTPAQILNAVEEVYNGGSPMSPGIARKVINTFSKFPAHTNDDAQLSLREKEILALLVKGNSYKMIAADVRISIHTVKTHIKNIYEKLHVHSQSEAVAKALRERLV